MIGQLELLDEPPVWSDRIVNPDHVRAVLIGGDWVAVRFANFDDGWFFGRARGGEYVVAPASSVLAVRTR